MNHIELFHYQYYVKCPQYFDEFTCIADTCSDTCGAGHPRWMPAAPRIFYMNNDRDSSHRYTWCLPPVGSRPSILTITDDCDEIMKNICTVFEFFPVGRTVMHYFRYHSAKSTCGQDGLPLAPLREV